MTFAYPWALVGLALLPVLGWWLARAVSAQSARVTYSDLRLLKRGTSGRVLAARALPWLRLPALALLILAVARPQTPAGFQQSGDLGIDIMLVLDISGSMTAEDFRPKNRFEVAREVLQEFIKQAGVHRLGLVVFSAKAFTQCPLAADHAIVSQLLDRVHIGMIEDGTAIGMAIATAAQRLEASKAKSKVIILLTDGVNNRGEIDPPTAAEAAASLGIKIYAIGVGREGGAPIPVPDPLFGKRYARNQAGQILMTKLDEPMLKKIAATTGGQYFRATDADALRRIYAQIDKMEKTQFAGKRERRFDEQFARFAWPGLWLLVVQLVLGATWLRKSP